MSTARQVAELYLRGSVVNITIANLTENEREHVAFIASGILALPGIVQARKLITKKLSDTIGGEYREDPDAADQENRITIWRAVVDLYYHRKYTFECNCCGTDSYVTKTGKTRIIDQLFEFCKACNCVEIVTVGDAKPVLKEDGSTVILEVGEFVDRQDFQDSYVHLSDGDNLPTSKTPIKYIPGAKKYTNPDKVFDTEDDTTKFFREFLWGGFKQILKENERKQHNKKPKLLAGRADQIIVAEILALLTKARVTHNFCPITQPEGGWFNIQVSLLQAPPEVSIELAVLLHKAKEHGIQICLANQKLRVAETLVAPDIETYISKPEYVLVLDNYTTSAGDDEQGSYTLNSISFKTRDGVRMDLDDHILMTDESDWLVTVRDSLPAGLTQRVFDLCCQRGEDWFKFSQPLDDGGFGDKDGYLKEPKISHMAQFFDVGRKAICEARNHIRLNTYRYMSKDERKNISLCELQEKEEIAALI